ncbi:cxxc_20_cxxc protein [Sarcina ventriculi]|uniref:Cxxc_20_cxxc protein n=1 Tax=Sarcina ventriculi TaxID=1267 RepID=A0ABM9UNJ9_SARVE|nr:cxxc_20_cxxc protein [Sarcina ventriculi]SPZ48864.1 cxxc_20_cxxc protein [Sarcina ventriculi]
MKCPNCCTRFTLLQRLNTNITTSKEMQCLNCKTKYKKITSFNSLCVGLSYFTSIFIIEMLIKLSTINEFLLILILINILSIIFYIIYILLCDNFVKYEIVTDLYNN